MEIDVKMALEPKNKLARRLGAEGVAALRADAIRQERQAAFVLKRDATLAKRRANRLESIETGAAERSDKMATAAWTWLTGAGSVREPLESVRMLSKYVVRDELARSSFVEELELGGNPSAPGPPMSRLAGDAGRGLRLHLSILAVANMVTVGGARFVNDAHRDTPGRRTTSSATQQTPSKDASSGLRIAHSAIDVADWAKMLGIPSVGKARVVRVHEVLHRLEHHKLLAMPAGNPSKFTLLSEDGTGRVWSRPELDPVDTTFNVPIGFWSNQWYLWLTHAEIATLFAIYHAWPVAPARAGREGVGLAESVRRATYDMSGERYSSMHELIEFGLVEMVTPSIRPRATTPDAQVKRPGMTHHIRPVRSGLDVSARPKIIDCLRSNSRPPRLDTLPALRATYAAELRARDAEENLDAKTR